MINKKYISAVLLSSAILYGNINSMQKEIVDTPVDENKTTKLDDMPDEILCMIINEALIESLADGQDIKDFVLIIKNAGENLFNMALAYKRFAEYIKCDKDDLCKFVEQLIKNRLYYLIKNNDYRGQFKNLSSQELNNKLISLMSNNNPQQVIFPEFIELIHAGADVNAKDPCGNTALMVACKAGYIDIVKLLIILSDYNVNSKDIEDNTALMVACQAGHTDIVKLLLKRDADVNAKNRWDYTALIFAYESGHTDIVKLLLEKSTDVNVRNLWGHTALIWAARKGHEDIVKLLLEKGADVNVNDAGGNTALMWAARKGYEDIVKLFIEKGADVNAKDRQGNTALMVACQAGHKDIAILLRLC